MLFSQRNMSSAWELCRKEHPGWKRERKKRGREKEFSSWFGFPPSRNCKDDPGGRRTNVCERIVLYMHCPTSLLSFSRPFAVLPLFLVISFGLNAGSYCILADKRTQYTLLQPFTPRTFLGTSSKPAIIQVIASILLKYFIAKKEYRNEFYLVI